MTRWHLVQPRVVAIAMLMAVSCLLVMSPAQAQSGQQLPERWKDKPAKVRQKDRDARWSVKYTKAKVKEGADPRAFKPIYLAIPMFGYKNHIGIDRAHGLIRTWDASAANAHDGARLPVLISPDNRLGCLGRHGLPLKEERGLPRQGHVHHQHPPAKAAPPADARARGSRQCEDTEMPPSPRKSARSYPITMVPQACSLF
jgi:hypothetical protein